MSNTEIIAYTDGSFNLETNTVGAASIIRSGEVKIPNHYIVQSLNDEDVTAMRQIAGELRGALNAIQYAIDCDFDSIKICYDYQGVMQWATGSWKANKPYTKYYRQQIEMLRQYITIQFEKVDAHTGVELNELADKTAKYACGVQDSLPMGIHATQVATIA